MVKMGPVASWIVNKPSQRPWWVWLIGTGLQQCEPLQCTQTHLPFTGSAFQFLFVRLWLYLRRSSISLYALSLNIRVQLWSPNATFITASHKEESFGLLRKWSIMVWVCVCVCAYLRLLSASVCSAVWKITIPVCVCLCVLICAKWICMFTVCALLQAIVRDSYQFVFALLFSR